MANGSMKASAHEDHSVLHDAASSNDITTIFGMAHEANKARDRRLHDEEPPPPNLSTPRHQMAPLFVLRPARNARLTDCCNARLGCDNTCDICWKACLAQLRLGSEI